MERCQEQLQVFEGNIVKQIKDLLKGVCPDKCTDVKDGEIDKLSDEVRLENAGKYKSCDHVRVNETHCCELNEIHTCDAVCKGLLEVIEFQNEPTLIDKESLSVAGDVEHRNQSDSGSDVFSAVGKGNKDRKAREFPNFELLSQESLFDGHHLDRGKSLDIGGKGIAMVENEAQQESSPRSKSHFEDIIFTIQDMKIIEDLEQNLKDQKP
ncbi:hypothetical protein OROHE_024046 [Orobanche hederae]